MGAISIFQDITSEEELLSELADIKQFMNVLQLIFDNAYLGIVFVDSNGIIQFMNRMYEDLLSIRGGRGDRETHHRILSGFQITIGHKIRKT